MNQITRVAHQKKPDIASKEAYCPSKKAYMS